MEEKPFVRKTVAKFYQNPQVIGIHTNWDIRRRPALQHAIESVVGVEPMMPGLFEHSRYNLDVTIGELFDRGAVAKDILAAIEEHFKDQ